MSAFGGKADIDVKGLYFRFSNRPFGVKHFQAVHRCSVLMSLAGSRFSSDSAPGPLYGAFLVKKFNQGDSTLDAVG